MNTNKKPLGKEPFAPYGQKRTLLVSIWNIVKATGPGLVSITAIIISVATYVDQHGVDASAAIAAQESAAEQVSYWLEPTQNLGRPELLVENRSEGAINDTWIHFYSPINTQNLTSLEIYFPTIPPCTIAIVSSRDDINMILEGGGYQVLTAPSVKPDSLITFTDLNGASWTKYGNGNLVQRWTPPRPNEGFAYGNPSFRPANGCT